MQGEGRHDTGHVSMRGTQTIIYYDRSSLSGGAPVVGPRYTQPQMPLHSPDCLSSSHSAACGAPGLSGSVSGAPLTFHIFLSSHGRRRFPNILSLLTAGGPASSVCGPSVGPGRDPSAIRSIRTQPGDIYQPNHSVHKVQ